MQASIRKIIIIKHNTNMSQSQKPRPRIILNLSYNEHLLESPIVLQTVSELTHKNSHKKWDTQPHNRKPSV